MVESVKQAINDNEQQFRLTEMLNQQKDEREVVNPYSLPPSKMKRIRIYDSSFNKIKPNIFK